MRKISAAVALVLALLAAGCGDSGSTEVTGEASSETKKVAAEPLFAREMGPEGERWLRATEAAGAGKAEDRRWSGLKAFARPEAGRLVFPHGPPPKEVVFKDLRVGKGPAIRPGDYFGAVYASFDYTSGRLSQKVTDGTTTVYSYGVDELVKGWEPGLRGMRAGGSRELIVPSDWAYGSGDFVYVVKLLWIGDE